MEFNQKYKKEQNDRFNDIDFKIQEIEK